MRPVLFFSCWLAATVGLTPRLIGQAPDFDREIAPILATRCLDCHQGEKPKGKLRLATAEQVRQGGKAGPAMIPGKPLESPLFMRVHDNEMPPKKPLPEAEKKLLERWIASGAKWGESPINPFRFTTGERAGYDWWSLKKPSPVEPPALAGQVGQSGNPIDAFVMAGLAKAGLRPSPEAGKRAMLRRLSVDLIGLPPTPGELAAFEADKAAGAYERQVERLLASPHHGERWARHWLDVARYGETDGFERNFRRANAWHYRDWLVSALNADMPYDRFARLQMAGDVLEPDNPDAVKASGFLVAGVYNTVLGNEQMRQVNRQDELEDLVGAVGQTFLGLTINCARCHDHKFDPITQEDYYRVASALSGVNHGERELPPAPGLEAEIQTLAKRVTGLEGEIRGMELPVRQALAEEHARLNGRKLMTGPVPPTPMAAWDLRRGLDDLAGKMKLEIKGSVKLGPEGARLTEGGYLRSAPLGKAIREKTLEAWVRVEQPDQQGGAVLGLMTPEGAFFDAIVYAELEKNRWMAGSDFFKRTKSFQSPDQASPRPEAVTHVAITYTTDGTITGYRDGAPYGQPYQSAGLFPFEAGKTVALLGCRLEPAGGNKMFTGTIIQARLYDRALSAGEVLVSSRQGGYWPSLPEVIARLTPPDRERHARLTGQLTESSGKLTALRATNRGRVYATVAGGGAVVRVLARGDLAAPGKVVGAGGVRAAGAPEDFGLAPDAPAADRRRKLAEWVSHPDNPLFARVMVNRLWLHHFGAGLIETPSDLGFSGGKASHPELLDWLAGEFVRRKLSLKAMHRLMVGSAAYRQESAPRADCLAKDADNRLFWRARPRRLDGEVLRDAMLQSAGMLNTQAGGPGVSDYKMIDSGNGTAYYEPLDPVGPEFNRRSLYRFTPRGGEQALLDLFDCPDCAAAAPRRNPTTTPLQALALWNGGFSLRMAESLAKRAEAEASDPGQRITRVYQASLERDPTAEERQAALELAGRHGLRAVCRALFNSNEFLTVE